MNHAKLFQIKRRIDEGYYSEGDVPDEVLDAIAQDIIDQDERIANGDKIVSDSITVAACCVLIPLFGYGILCLVVWVWG